MQNDWIVKKKARREVQTFPKLQFEILIDAWYTDVSLYSGHMYK